MIEFLYSDPVFHYAGRWESYSDSKGSGWQGSQIRFKVSGTSSFIVTAKILDASGDDVSLVVANINDGPTDMRVLSSAGGTAAGDATATFSLPDNGEHTVVLKLANTPGAQWTNAGYTRLKSVSVDNAGGIHPWGNQAPVSLGVVGDSWMALQNDWPYLMGSGRYSLHPVAFGGAKVEDLNAQYTFDRAGVSNVSEPLLDAILINSSVNDYAAGVSLSAFQSSLTSLVGKVRTKHPSAKIILLQSPRNVGAGMTYDQYGTAMSAVASVTANAAYVAVPPEYWGLFDWDADTYHLSFAGRKAFANYVAEKLDTILPPADTIKISTGSSQVTIPLFTAEISDAYSVPVLDTPEGLFRLRLVDVHGELSEGKVAIRLGDRLFQVSY